MAITTASGIYQIKSPSGNFYIGSAVNLRRRWNEHRTDLNCKRHYNKPLQNAAEKYGLDSFEFTVVELCAVDNLIEREQYFINTLKPEYNIQRVAGSTLGMKYSEETKQKVRIAATNISDETRIKRSLAAKAQWADKAAREKITKAIKTAANTEETKAKMNAINKGRKLSEETKRKMSVAAKARCERNAK